MQIHSYLLNLHWPGQSGLTLYKTTVNYILFLPVLVVLRREFRQGLLLAYVCLLKAFDFTPKGTLQTPLDFADCLSVGSENESVTKWVTSLFPVNMEVGQRNLQALSLFKICIDFYGLDISQRCESKSFLTSIGSSIVSGLVFAKSLEALHEKA